MNMAINLDIEFEKAVRFLAEHLPASEENSRKPILAHGIRVGVYLFEKNYPREIVLAGVLHDTLEFSNVSEQMIRDGFGEKIVEIVRACTKNRAISDSDKRIDELARRSAEAGKEALIVRAVDTIDSFKHYTRTENQGELDYCRKNAETILKYKPEDVDDQVFKDLREWL